MFMSGRPDIWGINWQKSIGESKLIAVDATAQGNQ